MRIAIHTKTKKENVKVQEKLFGMGKEWHGEPRKFYNSAWGNYRDNGCISYDDNDKYLRYSDFQFYLTWQEDGQLAYKIISAQEFLSGKEPKLVQKMYKIL